MAFHIGQVKFYNDRKNWGYIESLAANQPDIYVHASDICPNVVKNTYDDPSVDENSAKLYTGEYVSFEVETTERGIKAVRVTGLRRFDGSPGDLMCDRGRIKFTEYRRKRANARTGGD